MIWLVCGAYFLLSAFLVPAPPVARPEVLFRWDAPAAGCPDESEAIAALEHAFGGPLRGEGPRVTLIARVRKDGDEFDLRLWFIRDGQDPLTRTFRLPNCRALVEAGAVIAAMTLQPGPPPSPGGSVRPMTTVEAPTSSPSSTAASTPAVTPPRASPTARADRVRLGMRPALGLSLGDLPSVGALIRLALSLRWPRARLEFELSSGLPHSLHLMGGELVHIDLQTRTGIIRGCPVFTVRRVEFPLCGGIEAGAILARASGLQNPRTGNMAFVAVHIAPAVFFVPHRRLGLGMTVEGALHVLRPYFSTSTGVEVYRAAAGSVRILATIEVRFR